MRVGVIVKLCQRATNHRARHARCFSITASLATSSNARRFTVTASVAVTASFTASCDGQAACGIDGG